MGQLCFFEGGGRAVEGIEGMEGWRGVEEWYGYVNNSSKYLPWTADGT